MATFKVSGMNGIDDMLKTLANTPDDVKKDILTAMGDAAAAAIEKEGRSRNVYDPEWSGKHVLDSIKVKKPIVTKEGGSVLVTFSGTRTRGNQKTRNAEIAFINEFGAEKKHIHARPFVSTATKQNEGKIIDAGEAVYNDWLKNNF